MNCPVCKSSELIPTDLELGLPAFRCDDCGGKWIGGAVHWKWLDEHSNLPERQQEDTGLRQGKWKNKQIILKNWVRAATAPTWIAQDYGYLWWLNTAHKQWPSLPEKSFAALGYGSNTIWIDPEHDLVVVWRWHKDRSADEFFKRILAAVKV